MPILFVGLSVSGLAIVVCIVISVRVVAASEVSSGELLTLLGSETGEFMHPSNVIVITVAMLIKVNLIFFTSNHVMQLF